jgi:hypothetical protein
MALFDLKLGDGARAIRVISLAIIAFGCRLKGNPATMMVVVVLVLVVG